VTNTANSSTFTGPARSGGAIPRDRWQRPLVIPIGGGEPVPYTRVSTLAGVLDDTHNLTAWKLRQAMRGLLTRDDLRISAAAHIDDNKHLDKVADQALEAAASSAGATVGTALHTYTEKHDRGMDLGPVPADVRPDIDAYIATTKNMRMVSVEEFVVCDEVRAAGTFDRLIEFEGTLFIGDLKTGRIDFPHKFAIQKAIYARGVRYNPSDGSREAIGDGRPVDLDHALLLHLPAGAAKCTIHWIDIAAGWEAAQQAAWVHAWRKRKDLSVEVTRDRLEAPAVAPAIKPVAVSVAELTAPPAPSEDELADWIGQATAPEHLAQLWQTHGHHFTPALDELAAAQHALITGGFGAVPA
jgi:hypothetical protein